MGERRTIRKRRLNRMRFTFHRFLCLLIMYRNHRKYFYLLMHSLIHSFIHSFVRSFEHSFIFFIHGLLKTALAKKSTHSTTCIGNLKRLNIIQRLTKSLYLTPGSKLVGHFNESKFKMTHILEHLFSNPPL